MSTDETAPATAPTAAEGVAAPPAPPALGPVRSPHAPSLVLGLAVLLVAVLVVLGALTDVRVDTGAVVAVSLVALGALLVLGGALSGLRRR